MLSGALKSVALLKSANTLTQNIDKQLLIKLHNKLQ